MASSKADDAVDPCAGLTAQQHGAEARSTIKAVYAKKRWQEKHPLGSPRRETLALHASCSEHPEETRRAWEKRKSDFFLYAAYRRVAPYRCGGGPWNYWAVPCYIIACESHFSWSALNPSGAAGPYQIMVGRIYPARTRRQQLQNHRRAAEIWREQGPGAWVCA